MSEQRPHLDTISQGCEYTWIWVYNAISITLGIAYIECDISIAVGFLNYSVVH